MYKTKEEYLSEILERLGNVNKSLYLVSEKASKSYVDFIKIKLEEQGYKVDIRKCPRCSNVWDIIISKKEV